jgi:hypothetical protein
MSSEARPAAVQFDPGSDSLPPALEPTVADSDSAILLLVAADPDEAAARTAIALAEARARQGLATVLADGSMQRPLLHRHLGVQNLEGLADLFLFGASLEHVRVRPDGRDFEFISPGAYAPDPSAVLSSDRWSRVRRELEDEGVRMLLFVPADAPGLGILSQRAGEVVLIGDDAGAARAASRLHPTCRVSAVISPPTPPEPAAPAEPADDESTAAVAAAPVRRVETDLSEPVVIRRTSTRRRTVSPALIALVVVALAVAGWFIYREYVASPPDPEPAPTPQAQPVPAAPTRSGPVEAPLEISVQVEAHQDQASAEERVGLLRAAEPDLNFYVVPITSRGRVYYRVLAGPVADEEAGQRLMRRLVDAEHKSAMDDWAVRPSGLAFMLGEYDTRGAARARMTELAERGIPAYVVPLDYAEGPPRYRVWGGGFQHEREAEVMRQMLEEAGIEAPLVARTGAPIEEGS